MAPIYDVIEELGNAFAAEKQRYTARAAHPMNREQRRAQAKKGKHNPPMIYPAPPAARMVERVDAQVSAKQKTDQLIDARQAVNALRDDPDAMQQLAEYALQLASERQSDLLLDALPTRWHGHEIIRISGPWSGWSTPMCAARQEMIPSVLRSALSGVFTKTHTVF